MLLGSQFFHVEHLVAVDVALRVGFVPPTACAVVGVGGGTDAEIRRAVPVVGVVVRVEAWFAEVGNLIVLEAGCCGLLAEEAEHLQLRLLVHFGKHALGNLALQRCVLLDAEVVGGEVRHGESEDGVEGSVPTVYGLRRKTEDEVDADVVYVVAVADVDGFHDLCGGVTSVDDAQFVVVHALHTHADTVDAEGSERADEAVGDVVGVAFHGDFGVGGNDEVLADGGEDLPERVEGQRRGGASAEVDGVEQRSGEEVLALGEFAAECVDVGSLLCEVGA